MVFGFLRRRSDIKELEKKLDELVRTNPNLPLTPRIIDEFSQLMEKKLDRAIWDDPGAFLRAIKNPNEPQLGFENFVDGITYRTYVFYGNMNELIDTLIRLGLLDTPYEIINKDNIGVLRKIFPDYEKAGEMLAKLDAHPGILGPWTKIYHDLQRAIAEEHVEVYISPLTNKLVIRYPSYRDARDYRWANIPFIIRFPSSCTFIITLGTVRDFYEFIRNRGSVGFNSGLAHYKIPINVKFYYIPFKQEVI